MSESWGSPCLVLAPCLGAGKASPMAADLLLPMGNRKPSH